jgi:1,4-dihydroxy-2-naphthoate octaprenyltransferase
MSVSLKTWILAARPKTLWASLTPVVIGTAIARAHGALDRPSLFACLAGALCIQIGTNFANDYFDYVKGTDTDDRVGPTRVTASGMVSLKAIRIATVLAFLAVWIPGAYIIDRGGWPFLVIGLLSILFGVLYTGGPYPLGYIGVADFFVLIFFGPVAVGGTYYLHTLTFPSAEVIVSGFAPGLISTALLTVNNLRDIDTDRAAGKKSLAVRFGAGFARFEYLFCIVVPGVVIPLYLYSATGRHWFLAVPLITIMYATPSIKTVFTTTATADAYNAALARTGKLLLAYAVFFSAAWLI